MPRDKVTGVHQGYAFVELRTAADAEYAIRVLNNVKLFGKPMRVNMADRGGKAVEDEVNPTLFVGGLDEQVDEVLLKQTFGQFGAAQARVMYDPEDGAHRGFGFVTFETYEEADMAIATMNQQWLGGKQIQVSYAYKEGSNNRERYGSQAERLLAANRRAKLAEKAGRKLSKGPRPGAGYIPTVPRTAPPSGIGAAAAAAAAAPAHTGYQHHHVQAPPMVPPPHMYHHPSRQPQMYGYPMHAPPPQAPMYGAPGYMQHGMRPPPPPPPPQQHSRPPPPPPPAHQRPPPPPPRPT